MKTKKYSKHKGGAFVLIMAVMVSITMASVLIANLAFNNRYQAVHQSEGIQLYYMTKSGLDSVSEVLTNDRGSIRISDYATKDPNMKVPDISFFDGKGEQIGTCKIRVKRVLRDTGGAKEPWIEIKADTTMKDIRGGKDLRRIGQLNISVKNPLIREYDIAVN